MYAQFIHSSSDLHPLVRIGLAHAQFETIHPYLDGNGRIGRLLLAAMLLSHNLPPAVIEIKKKKFYLSYLRKSQLMNESAPLEDFVCDAILYGFKIIDFPFL